MGIALSDDNVDVFLRLAEKHGTEFHRYPDEASRFFRSLDVHVSPEVLNQNASNVLKELLKLKPEITYQLTDITTHWSQPYITPDVDITYGHSYSVVVVINSYPTILKSIKANVVFSGIVKQITATGNHIDQIVQDKIIDGQAIDFPAKIHKKSEILHFDITANNFWTRDLIDGIGSLPSHGIISVRCEANNILNVQGSNVQQLTF